MKGTDMDADEKQLISRYRKGDRDDPEVRAAWKRYTQGLVAARKAKAANEIPPSASPSTVEARPADSAPQSETASLGAEPLVTIGAPNFRQMRAVVCSEHGLVGTSASTSQAREIAYRHAAMGHAGAQGVVAQEAAS